MLRLEGTLRPVLVFGVFGLCVSGVKCVDVRILWVLSEDSL
jgi:hypothetical protein